MAGDTRAPTERANQGPTGASGVTVLDSIALVAGAAIASVHLRQATPSEGLTVAGWVLIWLTFAGVALTATGPFLVLIRRLSGRPGLPERLGDRLWALLGTPWGLAALPRIVAEGSGQLYQLTLMIGLGVACVWTVGIVWTRWVMLPPGTHPEDEPTGWTDRIGLVLAVAWPFQCGLGMIVLGSPTG